MKVTIARIAEELGVHPSTVSLALRDSPKIPPETTAKIKKTAAEMGYHINPYVSALMSARRQGKLPKDPPVLAFITCSDHPDDWKQKYTLKEFYDGCVREAVNLGMRIDSFWLGEPNLSADRLNNIFFARGIQGGILLPTGSHRQKMNFEWSHIAAVSYGIYDITPHIDKVRGDHYANMELILRILIERKFKRIGFMMDTPYVYNNHNKWLAAYLMYERNLPPAKERIAPYLDENPSQASFMEWFKHSHPDVIICTRIDKITSWLQQNNIRVPQDVSLVSKGLSEKGKFGSGIIENALICGKTAIEMLTNRIYHNQFGSPESPQCISVIGQWYEGNTLGHR